MKTIDLKTFFNKINYNWKKDFKNLEKIAYYTKTRVNSNPPSSTLSWGMEQTFLLKAIAEWTQSEHFFEIGTGRGTACYALSLVPSIKDIHTVDILQFKQKFSTAIGYKTAKVSLADIKDKIPFVEKSKIHFHHRSGLDKMRKTYSNYFDLCFIDGDHSSKAVILDDYASCIDMIKEDAIILWDDYDPEKFKVKEVVDTIAANGYDTILVEQRGHLFTEKAAEHNRGVVLMRKGKFDL